MTSAHQERMSDGIHADPDELFIEATEPHPSVALLDKAIFWFSQLCVVEPIYGGLDRCVNRPYGRHQYLYECRLALAYFPADKQPAFAGYLLNLIRHEAKTCIDHERAAHWPAWQQRLIQVDLLGLQPTEETA